MLNRGVTPFVPSQGSVGASGDLAPLAHLALALIGEGECVDAAGSRIPSADALKQAQIKPLVLEAKETISLINGTQAMLAAARSRCWRRKRWWILPTCSAALSCDALKGTDAAFDERIQQARPHPGQMKTAANLRARCLKPARSGNPIATAAACRMRIPCAAFRKSTARCATRSPIAAQVIRNRGQLRGR